jgi:3-(methylsulfanyl)propanoyl-CoA dehydrogenase
MLMEARCFNEGARALILWTSLKGDLELHSPDATTREAAGDFMALLTPVIKAYCSDQGFQSAVKCQQVFGGAGYIKDYPAEQFVRDARIAMIYEGANGVQAMDLVGRKLALNGGRAVRTFFSEIERALKDAAGDAFLAPWTEGLARAKTDLQAATMWLMQNAPSAPNNAGAAANDYLYLTALTALALTWLGVVRTAKAKLEAGVADRAFCENKIVTGRFFLARVLPDTGSHLAKIKSGAEPVMALSSDQF